MQPAGEDRLLSWLRGRLGPSLLGDDAAVLPAGRSFAVTVDSQIAGVHFVPDLDPAVVARRLLAVNLSDLAAMGAEPAYAFLALALPESFDARRFLGAFVAACRRHGVELAGGDLARSPVATATLTLLGRRGRGGRWLHRSAARPGHRLWLGGTVGESAAGQRLVALGARPSGKRIDLPSGFTGPDAAARRAVRRHLAPAPQLDLGRWLGRHGGDGGAIDVSDGIARDLHRLCRESGVGSTLVAAALPVAAGFLPLTAALGCDPLELALAGGEDYVLLFTLPADSAPPRRLGCHAVGTITRARRVLLLQNGVAQPLRAAGWDHLSDREE